MTSYYSQDLIISTDKWTVDLLYENWNLQTKTIKPTGGDVIIDLYEKGEWDSTLKIEVSSKHEKRTCIVTGIQGGTYLYKKEGKSEVQSVKIDGDNLVLSLGVDFISINLNSLKVNWDVEPDFAEVFEFYDLDNDYLLRGEVGIHRIDKFGNVIWTFTATDIWVNIEGGAEVEFTKDTIKLLDFNSDRYEIDFNGKLIEN